MDNTAGGIMDFEVSFSKNRGKKCGLAFCTFRSLQTIFRNIWGRMFHRKVKVICTNANIAQGTQEPVPTSIPTSIPTAVLSSYYSEDDRIIDELYQAIMENNPDFEYMNEFDKLYEALPYTDPDLDEQFEEIVKAYAEKDAEEIRSDSL